jgi:predicted TIM-barrel fold metal-dependent hydrolase
MPVIWDLHCHLSGIAGRTVDERMANLIRYADRMGVARLVLSMGTSFLQEPTPEQFRQQNDDVVQALSHWHHRAFGLAYINPHFLPESLAEIERLVANGPMIGIKLWVARRCSDSSLDAIVTRCAELKALIFQHTWIKTTGNLAGESTPLDLAELARRHPRIPMILGHCGGTWELGIRAVRDLPNVSVETAGFDPTAGMVEMAVKELGAERILYGSDAPGRSFASQIAKVAGANVTEPEKDLIYSRNLQRMLDPILRTKGGRRP